MEQNRVVDPNNFMFEINVAELQRNFVLRPHTAIYKTLRYINDRARVLDIGCAWGYLAKLLKPKNCNVIGVEKEKKIANMAKVYCDEVIIGDIEDIERLEYNLGDSLFDVIVCLDVLEHLVRPDKLVFALKKFLLSNGTIIASIPNVARFEHRINILLGKFNYQYAGGLSRGHLRFFTKYTAKKLLLDAGYKIIKLEYTGLASKIKIFPTLTAYQFLLIAIHR